MDPGGSLLSQLLLETITPVVMVIASELVEESCKKNNLNFVQLLKPFCTFNNIDVPVRTASDLPYRLQKFKLRMFYASDIFQPKVESAEEHLKQVVTYASESTFSELEGNQQQLEAVHKMVSTESLSSWFQIYNQEFIRTLSFSDHEAFDHPVACLLVVSSKDDNPLNKFADLFNTDKLPSLFNDGAMDPKIMKHFLLVHDYQDGPADRANEILLEMKKTFGQNECKLLCLNSPQNEDSKLIEDMWSSFISQYLENPSAICKHGEHLCQNDLEEIYNFMQDFAAKDIIPYMEQRIRSLNQHVSATRKGFKNQIKNLWWRKGKEESTDSINGPTYSFTSIESQIRLLGDYAFMLHDYELALSNYRLLSTDYKIDKSWKRFAGVQEMIGLSLFMMDQARKEAESSMETAFATYQKIGPSCQRYATRCAIWWAEMHKARGQFKEAASVYFRIPSEEPTLRAAVLLEQAAYCYLQVNPSMLRKYAFNLVLSGNRYNIAGQRKHALRVYICVLPVFEEGGWNYIRDHINSNVGRWYAHLGKPDIAVQHFLRLLACSHQPASTQETFLADFLNIFQALEKKDEMLQLSLPEINMSSLRVLFEDHRTYASNAAVIVPEKTWELIEEGLVPSSIASNWLEPTTKSTKKPGRKNDHPICIAGESVAVELEFTNPLHIPIEISSVSLICDFHSDMTPQKPGVNFDENGLSERASMSNSEDKTMIHSETTAIIVSEEAFNLKGGQNLKVHLKVTPQKEGFLHIIGVKWILLHAVTGQFEFEPHLNKRAIRGRSKGLAANPSFSSLKFYVDKRLPKVEGTIHRMPSKANAGEIHRLVLELSNPSTEKIQNMKLKINHPRFLLVGEPSDLDAEFPTCLEGKQDREGKGVSEHSDISNCMDGLFTFPKDIAIEGGSTLLWPLWLHTSDVGTVSLCMSIYYETETPSENISYRVLRVHYKLQVFQSLQLSVKVVPWCSKLQQFLLHVDIQNRNSTASSWLRQISTLGSNWEISSLQPFMTDVGTSNNSNDTENSAYVSASVCPSQLLPSGEATSLFFKLMDTSKSVEPPSVAEASSELQYSNDLKLGPPGSDEPLFDVASGPLFKFHLEERKAKERSNKSLREPYNRAGLSSANSKEHGYVDLVLITQQEDEALNSKFSNVTDYQQFSSHHLCYLSIKNMCPIWWIMEGPKTVTHDFSELPFCEIKLDLTIKNCSNLPLSLMMETIDNSLMSQMNGTSQVSAVQNQFGWYNITVGTEESGKNKADTTPDTTSVMPRIEDANTQSFSTCTAFIWGTLNSVNVKQLEAGSSIILPLSVAVFAPGIFDLSRYKILWKLDQTQNAQLQQSAPAPIGSAETYANIQNVSNVIDNFSTSTVVGNDETSGVALGHPYFLSVLQSG